MSRRSVAAVIACALAIAGCREEPPGGPSAVDQGPIDPKAAEALEFLSRVAHPPPSSEAKQFCKSLRALNRVAERCSRCVDALVKALPHVTEEMNQGACWLKDLGRVQPPRPDLCRALVELVRREQEGTSDYAVRALAHQGAGCRAESKAILAWLIPRMRAYSGPGDPLIADDMERLAELLPSLAPAEAAEVRAAAAALVERAEEVLARHPTSPALGVVERLRDRARELAR